MRMSATNRDKVTEMKQKEIKIQVEFTPGYEERFIKACVEAAQKRLKKQEAA